MHQCFPFRVAVAFSLFVHHNLMMLQPFVIPAVQLGPRRYMKGPFSGLLISKLLMKCQTRKCNWIFFFFPFTLFFNLISFKIPMNEIWPGCFINSWKFYFKFCWGHRRCQILSLRYVSITNIFCITSLTETIVALYSDYSFRTI